jgi:hypothetical protein
MHTKALDKRIVRRTRMVYGLRISQASAAQALLAHTLDISYSGAKIGGLRDSLQPGSTLVIHYKHSRAQARVMWSRQLIPGEIQVGVEFLKPAQFWAVDMDENCVGTWVSANER